MKILYLTHRVPYPPDRGDTIRSYHHLLHLARRHDVSLLSFVDSTAGRAAAEVLLSKGIDTHLVPLPKISATLRGLRELARGRSYAHGFFAGPEMRSRVARLFAVDRFDVVWAASAFMAKFIPAHRAMARVVDVVDTDSAKWRQFADDARWPMRWVYACEARAQALVEARLDRRADQLLFVSAREVADFPSPGEKCRVVPVGVDVAASHIVPSDAEAAYGSLLFVGTLDYLPNEDSVLWLLREVLPALRSRGLRVRLRVVGHRPTRSVHRAVAACDAAELHGSVADVRPFFSDAAAFVAPDRLGRGVQTKVLQAMAMGVPVVATSRAATGLDVEDGVHVLIADTVEAFVSATERLLRDAGLRAAVAARARQLVEEKYGWAEIGNFVDDCLERAMKAAAQRARAARGSGLREVGAVSGDDRRAEKLRHGQW